jgi:hypothetical protein
MWSEFYPQSKGMASHQRRTEDLLRLKTRSLVLQNMDGSYPVGGAVPSVADTSGTVGFTPVTIDASGNMTVPGNLTVDGLTNITISSIDISGTLTVARDASFNSNIYVHGDGFTTGSATIDYIDFPNYSATKPHGPTDLTQVSSLYSYVNRLTWEDTSGSTHDVLGWEYAPPDISANTFDLIDISGVTGTDPISLCLIQTAKTTNKLLTLLNNANAFLNVISIVPPQPSTAVITAISVNGYDISFSYVTGSVSPIVSYYYKIYRNNNPISLPVILGPPSSGTHSVFVPDTTAYYPLQGPPPPYLGNLSLSVSIVYTDFNGNNKEGPLSPPYLTNIINIDNGVTNYYNYIAYLPQYQTPGSTITAPLSTWVRCTVPSQINYLSVVFNYASDAQPPGIILNILGSNATFAGLISVIYIINPNGFTCGNITNNNSFRLTSYATPGVLWTLTQP